ncbi:SDR family NAD(P)-dependent oxidoreductase [Hoyosella subflava]|uniref:SDR family NAD(P)-dependent oxidoreductase n=1 Tax=Hoyosella subflava TaxID=639313 RepID=UPI0002FC48E9|nr:SDR family NAD(P)-dependent oxidoreductase [Hoyosella subflava]
MSIFRSPYPSLTLALSTVLVTGSGRGIGRATAALFAQHGARVLVTDVDLDAAEEAAAEIGPDASAHRLDVRSRRAWDELANKVGTVDILVNNAGIMPLAALLDETDQTIDATMDINVRGPMHGMRVFGPQMVERGQGHIVNVASLAGKIPVHGMVAYNASKFAAVGLSAAARLEFADHGVSVSTVLPSAVRTELSSGVQLGHGLPTVDAVDVARAILRTCTTRQAEIAVPRYLSPADVALAVAPERLTSVLRTVIGARRALTGVDHGVRGAYDQRVARIANTES